MLAGCASALDQSDVMQICFESGSAEKGALFEELDDEKILLPVVGGTLPVTGPRCRPNQSSALSTP
jgi:hypothetical protein